jgi:hypothetical protein
VAVPGPVADAETAVALGADVVARATADVIESLRPDVVVVDEPVAAQTGSWIIAAQRVGALVLDVSDLGLQSPDEAPEGARPATADVRVADVARVLQGARR